MVVTETAARWAPPSPSASPALSDTEITTLIREGRAARGMPPQVIPAADMAALLQHLRSIERREAPLPRRTVRIDGGPTLGGRGAR